MSFKNFKFGFALALAILTAVPFKANAGAGMAKDPADKPKASRIVVINPEKRWGRALWRSALVPGWGQWKNGDAWFGLAVLGTMALNATWLTLQGQAEAKSYDEYLRAKSPADAQKAWDNNRLQANLSLISQYSLGTLYVAQMGEAVYSAPVLLPDAASQEVRPVLLALDWEF